MDEITTMLHPRAPFDFGQSLAFLRGFPLMRDDQTITGDAVTRAVVAARETVVFRAVGKGTVDEPLLDVTLSAERPISDAVREAALDRVAFFLSIADDLTPFYALGRDDAAFAPVIAQLYGFHQVKFLTPFDNAAWAILSQRTPMAAARKTWNALIDRYGSSLTVGGTTYRVFPAAERLATVAPDDLLTILPNLRKAPYLHAAARAFDDVDEQWLRSAPSDEVYAWLRRIPGIGEWSATFVLIRALGRMERTSVEDAALRAAVKVYGPVASTPEGLRDIAQRYAPFQGYWTYYLRAFA